MDAAANVERAKLSDPAVQLANPRNQRRDNRLAERAVVEERFDEHRARHSRHERIVDRKDADRARVPSKALISPKIEPASISVNMRFWRTPWSTPLRRPVMMK